MATFLQLRGKNGSAPPPVANPSASTGEPGTQLAPLQGKQGARPLFGHHHCKHWVVGAEKLGNAGRKHLRKQRLGHR
jgi:hypothetical protein